MHSSRLYDVIIIGGGLAGLSCALDLSRSDLRIALIEKYPYPRHKVCGEYVSNEILPYLKSLGADPFSQGAVAIDEFRMTDPGSGEISVKLPLGGFGLSRYSLDNHLYQLLENKIDFYFTEVNAIQRADDEFQLVCADGRSFKTPLAIGAYGKRSGLDKTLGRPFIHSNSPWLGVKAHYAFDRPQNRVDLHHFKGGYCGISNVEENRVNACYLVHYSAFKSYGKIDTFQKEVMIKNPELRNFYQCAKPLFDKPLSIAQISFQTKAAVFNGIPMIGDSAGLIHPLCGNGMAMAIHSGKILADLLHQDLYGEKLLLAYQESWKQAFSKRLKAGKYLQRLLIKPQTNKLAFKLARTLPGLVPAVVRKTHGEVLV